MDLTVPPSALRTFAAKGQPMRRVLPLIAAVMVMLTLWSGTAAHAAEDLRPAAAEMAMHFDGDGDEAPADDHGTVPHHHGICHADHVGIPAALAANQIEDAEANRPHDLAEAFAASADLGAAIRPPIA